MIEQLTREYFDSARHTSDVLKSVEGKKYKTEEAKNADFDILMEEMRQDTLLKEKLVEACLDEYYPGWRDIKAETTNDSRIVYLRHSSHLLCYDNR